jgi:A/G-specific adenine glycosylase
MNLNKKKKFQKLLLHWQKSSAITYPWRNGGYTPFQTLLTEILLRKTNAPKVKNFITDTIKEMGTPYKIKEAGATVLRESLKPYGMSHKKSAELSALASKLDSDFEGTVPSNKDKLLELPGVGNYIANCVLCFSFDQRVPILDVNIIRLLTRVFSIKSERARPREDPELWKFAESLLPRKHCKEFNLALLDLSMRVCKAKKPECQNCPLAEMCDYFKHQRSLKQFS